MSSVDQKIFNCDVFISTLLSGLKNLREDNQLNDVVLKVQGREFNCHKLILAANSKYFLSIFTADFHERSLKEIRMPAEIDEKAMQALLDFFYSGQLALSHGNIESVFRATDYMRLDPLLEMCLEFMQETLDVSNCVQRYEMTGLAGELVSIEYSSPRMDNFREAAAALIIEEATNVVESEDFLSLRVDLISKILRSNSQPEKAESLCILILKWVEHDEQNRRELLLSLLRALPVNRISIDFFSSKIRSEELLRRDRRSVLWLVDNARIEETWPPVSQNQSNLLFFADRYRSQKCFVVRVENPKPVGITDRPEISFFSGVSHKKQIYLLCGRDTEKIYRLDDPHDPWVQCDFDLKFRCCEAGCVVVDDYLYAVGSYDWKSQLYINYCMKFNFVSGRKESLPATIEMRYLPGVAAYANTVYAACGIGASSSIERFDEREGEWCVIGRYASRIDGCSSATAAGYLYSCDVCSGKVGRFDLRSNRSQEICSLPSVLDNRKCIASIEGEIYGATGGTLLKYDSVADKWNNLCPEMDLQFPIIVPWI